MRRLLLGLGIALFGSFCALGWQVLALSALGWLGAGGLIGGGLLMLSPLLERNPVVAGWAPRAHP